MWLLYGLVSEGLRIFFATVTDHFLATVYLPGGTGLVTKRHFLFCVVFKSKNSHLHIGNDDDEP